MFLVLVTHKEVLVIFAMNTITGAYDLLKQLGASPRLLMHAQLVGEAAALLLNKLQELDTNCDELFVQIGVVLHDVGKTLYPEELSQRGNLHEATGERLLLAHNVDQRIARCCRSHAQWKAMNCTLEELLIALADKLWKGNREAELESLVIQEVSKRIHGDYWELFVELDECFEAIAADGHSRLLRSQSVKR